MKRIDVIISIGAIAITLAIIVPGIYRARENARTLQCMNCMKNLSFSLVNYHYEYSSTFPTGTVGSSKRTPEHRWSYYPQLIPQFLPCTPPPIDYETDSRDSRNWPLEYEIWYDPADKITIPLRAPEVIICPNATPLEGEHNQAFASYVGITGVGEQSPLVDGDDESAGVFGYDRCTSLADIKSKQDNTILAIETTVDRDVWLFGGRPTLRWVTEGENQLGEGKPFGGLHSGVTVVGMVDGTVTRLSNTIDPRIFVDMARINRDVPDDLE
ncbi:MAG: DUF1559 domain-containing protein [Planctomycetaceae bacterium]|nr:DUF1559 domain-containing protein [Planctomycetaceae bacterium]